MKYQNYILGLLFACLMLPFSCSEVQDASSIDQPTVVNKAKEVDAQSRRGEASDYYAHVFMEGYQEYAHSFNEVNKNLNADYWRYGSLENSPYLSQALGSKEEANKLLNTLTEVGADFEELEFDEIIATLLRKGSISNAQADYLIQTADHLYSLENAEAPIEDFYAYIIQRFNREILDHYFEPFEASVLQLFGYDIMYNLELASDAYGDKSYENKMRCGWTRPIRTILCALAATAAVAAVAAIVYATGTAQFLAEVCGLLGLPNAPIACEVALAIGIWTYIYRRCCGDIEEPCLNSTDPCCEVTCGYGQMCNGNGDCVPDPNHCANITCPDGLTCVNGACLDLFDCVFDYHCNPDEQCIGGMCVPL